MEFYFLVMADVCVRAHKHNKKSWLQNHILAVESISVYILGNHEEVKNSELQDKLVVILK